MLSGKYPLKIKALVPLTCKMTAASIPSFALRDWSLDFRSALARPANVCCSLLAFDEEWRSSHRVHGVPPYRRMAMQPALQEFYISHHSIHLPDPVQQAEPPSTQFLNTMATVLRWAEVGILR